MCAQTYCVDYNRRQSLNDRICDDLFELIVSYLPLADKIRLQCVSKRFLRVIFNKQYVLKLENRLNGQNNLFKLMVRRDYYSNDKQILLNKTAFESVLKKCKALTEIAFDCEFNNREFALKAITKHCSHLKKISLNFHDISEHIVKDFGHKFGQQLIAIDFGLSNYSQINGNEFDYHHKRLIQICPNLQTLKGVKLSYFITNDVSLPKLKVLKLYYEESDQKLVQSFIDIYRHQLKTLHILNGIFWSENTFHLLLKLIKNCNNLEELKLTSIKIKEYSPEMFENINSIGLNCKRLKRFCLSAQIESLIVSNLLKSISQYESVECLELVTYGSNFAVEPKDKISVKALQSCKQLTHLSLMSLNLSDNFFDDIHLYLPQLTHLNISFNDEITNNTMNSLSKLTRLSVLIIRASKKRFLSRERIDEGMCKLIEKCPQLRSIRFFSRPNITNKTIEALIQSALSKPKVHFNCLFADIDMPSKYNPYFTIIKFQNSSDFPKNLNISTNF